MLPRLEAQEKLSAITAAAIGSGSVEKSERERIVRDLKRTANSGERARKATPKDLAGMGIGIRPVTRKQSTSDG